MLNIASIGIGAVTFVLALFAFIPFLGWANWFLIPMALVGLVLGLVSSWLIGWSLGWPVSVSFGSIAMALGISAAVGLVFGSYPARRASLLDPIDALRTE